MLPLYKRAFVAGHTLEIQMLVPRELARDKVASTMLVSQRFGAAFAFARLRELEVNLAPLQNPDGDHQVTDELVHCRLLASPHGSLNPKADKKPDSLRIGEAEFLRYERGTISANPRVRYHPVAPGTKNGVICFCLEANSPYPESPFQNKAGAVVLHLTSSNHLDDKKSKDLCTWLETVRKNTDKFIIVTTAHFLNFVKVPLTEDRSWEAFTEDCVAEFESPGEHNKQVVEQLLAADHLVIRHNAFAAVEFRKRKTQTDKPQDVWLYYLADEKLTLPSGPGFLVGSNSILVTSLTRALVTNVPDSSEAASEAVANEDRFSREVDRGLRDGILRMARFAHRGYLGKDENDKEKRYFDENWGKALFEKTEEVGPIACCIRRLDVAQASGRSQGWSILGRKLTDDKESCQTIVKACSIGTKIIRSGLKAAVEAFQIPVVAIGGLKITERQMFEDYWEIQASMRKYLNDLGRERKPLSLAVFGAPGGGKSFGVKQLAVALNSPHLEPSFIETNVSQYSSVNDLARELRRVRDISLSGKVPLVFFDEFDAFWNRRAFGWLQYFLAPMQDGEFGVGDRKIKFPHAIFVFVGGLNHSFDMFNGRLRNREFIEAKGPDFVSRLAKHLDIPGIDHDHDGDFTYVIRRAVILRQKIEEYLPGVITGKNAMIDEDVIRAFLKVPRFKHGVRSLEAIIRTTRVAIDKPHLHWGTLPQADQLEMHVSLHELQLARAR